MRHAVPMRVELLNSCGTSLLVAMISEIMERVLPKPMESANMAPRPSDGASSKATGWRLIKLTYVG
jgi:hypothetical protein